MMALENPADAGLRVRARLQRESFLLDVDLRLPSSGVSALFGPSGSGKTSVLRCIAGLEPSCSADISLAGRCFQNKDTFLPVHKRALAYVFQESNLFAHLTVRQNLNYAKKRVKRASPNSSNTIEHSEEELLAIFNIEHLLDLKAPLLSGGEAQRVAIVRALLSQPELLLLDEPLASLDEKHKQEILPYLEKIKTVFKRPIVYVSHSVAEISRLADYIAVINSGKVQRVGPAVKVLANLDFATHNADEIAVAIPAEIMRIDAQWQLADAVFQGGTICLPAGGLQLEQKLKIKISASDVSLCRAKPSGTSISNVFAARVIEIAESTRDAVAIVKLDVGGVVILAQLTRRSVHHLEIKIGDELWAQIKSVAFMA